MFVSIPALIGGALWVLVVLVFAIVRAGRRTEAKSPCRTPMVRETDTVRVDIGTPDLDARSSWRFRGESPPGGKTRDRVSSSRHEVTLEAPHAEATVVVTGEEGQKEARRCSPCMN